MLPVTIVHVAHPITTVPTGRKIRLVTANIVQRTYMRRKGFMYETVTIYNQFTNCSRAKLIRYATVYTSFYKTYVTTTVVDSCLSYTKDTHPTFAINTTTQVGCTYRTSDFSCCYVLRALAHDNGLVVLWGTLKRCISPLLVPHISHS